MLGPKSAPESLTSPRLFQPVHSECDLSVYSSLFSSLFLATPFLRLTSARNQKAKKNMAGLADAITERAEERAEEKIFEEGGYTALWQYRTLRLYHKVKTCSCCA
jgi:hypothetical protein